MSDFLSNFENKNYQKRNGEPSKSEPAKKTPTEPKVKQQETSQPKQTTASRGNKTTRSTQTDDFNPNENMIIDPTYKQKKRKKRLIVTAISLVTIGLLWWLYFSMTHVPLPNFIDKNISEVRTWANTNNITLETEQKYNTKKEANVVLAQNKKVNSQIKKGSSLTVTLSIGPNPDEVLKLPQFKEMTKSEAQQWIESQKAENISITDEFNAKIAKTKFIKQNFLADDVSETNYKRKDQLLLYYSKGVEVFEKNIDVPDFSKKTKDEVSQWSQDNDVKITFENGTSDTIEVGTVISQSVKKGVKIAKKSKITVSISTLQVPNFNDYTLESAAEIEGIATNIKKRFSTSAPYGSLISQSLEAGTFIDDKANNKPLTVVYSAGKPYLKSYFGSLEGELAEAFYNDYTVNGADITYTIYPVNSAEERGTVVEMNNYNAYVSMDYTVSIGISNGNGYTPTTDKKTPDDGSDVVGDTDEAIPATDSKTTTTTDSKD